MTDEDIGKHMRVLAADANNPLSVTCWLCYQFAGEPCREMPGYQTRLKHDGVHPLRDVQARQQADRSALLLLASIREAADDYVIPF